MIVTELAGFEDKCCGCFSCSNICPTNAITMKLDHEGFYYPYVDKNTCINCGKCTKVCNINSEKAIVYKNNNDFFYVQAHDKVRNMTSSGGVFYLFAKNVIEQGGIVFGASFDKKKKCVIHSDTDHINLSEILRSKYVQSYLGVTYTTVRYWLDKGRVVLFCGTPCQIYGLIMYLGKHYDNLITVDFVCHGVPSTGFFYDMIKEQEEIHNSEIHNVTFREKDKGWRKQVIKFYFDNGDIEVNNSDYYYYYYCFLQNISLRKSCFTCTCPESHIADITIWDAWNIHKDDNLGTSAVMINTIVGTRLFNAIRPEVKMAKPANLADFEICFSNHSKMKIYRRARKSRKSFFEFYTKYGFLKTLKFWYPIYFRINEMKSQIRTVGVKVKRLLKKI